MSNSPATRPRPLSPHLSIYRFTPTMAVSIIHRATGIALYFGTLLLAWWLIAASLSQDYFDWVNWLSNSWIGRIVLFGFTWALMQHMLGGLRHFLWDTGSGLEKHTATKIAVANFVGAVGLTLLIWVFGFWVRSGF